MARHGLQIVKKVSFRGATQEFSNVYYYEGGTLNATDASNLAATVKGVEANLHGSDVTFVRAAVWTAGGTPSQNNMIWQGTLSGTGGQANNTSLDRERALLVKWPAGLDTRGRTVFLKKWYHCCGNAAAHIFTAAEMQQTSKIPTADLAAIAAVVDDLEALTIGANNLQLTSESGRTRTGGVQVYPWLEHHQFGEMWR